MAGRKGRLAIGGTGELSRALLGLALMVAPLCLVACASAPKALAKRADAPAVAPQTIAPAPAPTPSTVGEPVAAPVRGNEAVVIDEGKADGTGAQDLAEAAAAERQRRRTAAASTVVVTNENLAEHATGRLTISQGSVTAPAGPPAPANDLVKDEKYWRERVRGLREQWAGAVDSIGELEARAASLRTRFYAQDDPYVRDGEIKPAWDRTLDNLQAAREHARAFEEKLGQALEEGRQAGALPGWLRDGIELEPSERPYQRPDHEVARDDANLVYEPEELGQPPQR